MTVGATTRIDELLDATAWNGFQKGVVGLVALALLFDGLDSQVLGLAIPALIEDWGVSRGDLAPVVAAGLIGMCIGAPLGGFMSDRVGRKWALILSVAVFGFATAASALVDSVGALLAARFVVGLGLGGALPTSTALIAEFTPARSRSIGIAIGMVTIPIGSMVASVISAAIIEDLGWRTLFVIGGLAPVVLAAVFIRALPESPRYLLGRSERRSELLSLLAKAGCAVDGEALETERSAPRPRAPISALFGAGTAIDTLLAWAAFFLTMLALYTVVSWGPAMLANEAFALSFTGSALAAFALGGIAGAVTSGWMVTWLGSRRSQVMLAGGGAVLAFAMAATFTGGAPAPGLLLALIATLGFAITGMQNSMYILCAHLYSTQVRGTGVGAALAVARLGAVASAFTGALSVELGGGMLFFAVIGIGLALSAVTASSVRRPVPAFTR
jgi:AAHS family 4-hydroxybenzoate transporter-like MFS transporter